ncbi:MAG TPA: alpha/beta fold hydrolase [candidate division Zixibacteria bacterium]|nr:alpha/beta fold hydrolase [candidate division Zixibacteria bacterium]
MKRMSSSWNVPSRTMCVFLNTVLVCAFLALAPATGSAGAVDECVHLHDSLRLCYTFQTDDSVKTRALVVTLPMLGRDRTSYSKIVDSLAAEFPQLGFFNFDLRGHGKSTSLGAGEISYKSMKAEDFSKIPDDIKEALRLIREERKELKDLPVIVIGASIGANSAGILANIEPRVKAAALLSPGMFYRGLMPAPHVKMTDERRLLYMVGKADAYSYISTDSLYRMTAGEKRLEVYNTPNHGTNIPNNSPGALGDLVEWVRETLVSLKIVR